MVESRNDDHRLTGVRIVDDYGAIQEAHMRRHPHHCSYIPARDVTPLSDLEAKAYGRLNEQLHEEIRRICREHFADTPIPPELESNHDPYFTPFTYQNLDWYGPTYECYVTVVETYVERELLARLQALLTGEHIDWCILVPVVKSFSDPDAHEIALFSDQAIIQRETANTIDIAAP